MLFTEDRAEAEFIIRACGADAVTVNDRRLTASFMLLPGQPAQAWPATADESLRPEHFAPVFERKLELVVLGTGAAFRLPDPEVYAALLSREIGLEAMTTLAACRTYNLLAQDGRAVAACLILPA